MAFIRDGMKRKEPNLTFDPATAAPQLTEEELLEHQKLEEEMARLKVLHAKTKKGIKRKA